ncbi:MAG TPA: SCO family protein [Nitrospirota bacterium]
MFIFHRIAGRPILVAVSAVLILLAAFAQAEVKPSGFGMPSDPQDQLLKEIGVDEHLGAVLPLDLRFLDQNNRQVTLRDYFHGSPILLSLNYYKCPMLCPMTFRNLSETIGEMKGFTLGRDFKVVTVSFNPDEKQETAKEKSAETYAMLKTKEPDPSLVWPFLRGNKPEIDKVTRAVGYRYKKTDEVNFAHPTVLIVLSPEGKVTRYLYGIKHDPMNLRLAIIEAAKGRVGQSQALNTILLYCFHYDPAGRKYALAATRIMAGAGALTVMLLGGLILFLRFKGRAGAKEGGPK